MKTWAAVAMFALLAAVVGAIGYRVAVPSEQQHHAQQVALALASCQRAIVALASNGDAETPPYVANYGRGDEFYFAWPKGTFHFANAFGGKEPMSASCIGTLGTGTISTLTVNGKDFR